MERSTSPVGSRAIALACAAIALTPAVAVAQAGGGAAADARMLLRMKADTGVVGQYRFTTNETQRLAFDIPSDDPRASLLESATTPRSRETKIAATIVSMPREAEEDRRYVVYWLGYSVTGDDVRSLTPMQWDSIFQATGRRALLRMSATGEPLGVEVTSEAVRPVGQAFAFMLSGLASDLPADSVSAGTTWRGGVALPVRRPDGSRALVPVQVTYRLRELLEEADGWIARIEFDGAPLPHEAFTATGRYFGEAIFDATAGRFDDMMALAEIEVEWPPDPNGLPASRSLTQWQMWMTRARGGR